MAEGVSANRSKLPCNIKILQIDASPTHKLTRELNGISAVKSEHQRFSS
jgi:hypothetical protein